MREEAIIIGFHDSYPNFIGPCPVPRICLGCQRQLPGYFQWSQGRYGDAGWDSCEYCFGRIKVNDNDGCGPPMLYYFYQAPGQLMPDYRWRTTASH